MSYVLYHQSIEGATLTYSATEDANYPDTNMQDRYKNTFFKDTAIAAVSVNCIINFGSARACSHIILGNYIATSTDDIVWLQLEYADDAAFTVNNGTSFLEQAIESATLTNYLKTFTSQSKQYWRITIADDTGDNLANLQIGTIYLGTSISISHSPEPNETQSADYVVNINQGVGGIRSGSIDNTTVRRLWNYDWKLLSETDKTNLQTFRDSIYMNKDLSRYPFYWSPDTGTTLYYSRTKGELTMKQQAYQAWTWNSNFEEEL